MNSNIILLIFLLPIDPGKDIYAQKWYDIDMITRYLFYFYFFLNLDTIIFGCYGNLEDIEFQIDGHHDLRNRRFQ